LSHTFTTDELNRLLQYDCNFSSFF